MIKQGFLILIPFLILSCSDSGSTSDTTKSSFAYTIASTNINSFNSNNSGICIDRNNPLLINYSIISEGKLGDDPDRLIKNSYLEASYTKFYFRNIETSQDINVTDTSSKRIIYNGKQSYTYQINPPKIPQNGTYKVTVEVKLREYNGDDRSTSSENLIDSTFNENINIGNCVP